MKYEITLNGLVRTSAERDAIFMAKTLARFLSTMEVKFSIEVWDKQLGHAVQTATSPPYPSKEQPEHRYI